LEFIITVIFIAFGALIAYCIFQMLLLQDWFYLWYMKRVKKKKILVAYEGEHYFHEDFKTVYEGHNNTYRFPYNKIGKIQFLGEDTLDYCGTYKYKFED